MRILLPEEVERLIAKSKHLPEPTITSILDELERKHPAIYRFIYGEPSDAVGAMNKDMGNIFLELAFDVVWAFREAFGKPPRIMNEDAWVFKKMAMIDAELKSIAPEFEMDVKFRTALQERFAEASFQSGIQLALLKYLRDEVVRYASFEKRRAPAVHLTNNLLFVLVRLMGELYNEGKNQSA